MLIEEPINLVACLAFVGCVIAGLWAGAPLSTPAAVVLLGMVALVLLPDRLELSEQLTLWICVALQVGLAFGGLHLGLQSVATWTHRLLTSGL